MWYVRWGHAESVRPARLARLPAWPVRGLARVRAPDSSHRLAGASGPGGRAYGHVTVPRQHRYRPRPGAGLAGREARRRGGG
ncbi:hypothetical protein TPA0909_63120 [Streptomyces albus]|nr:hypothetical protein TPA0909_63120 [Streptomyces albus]